jgi:hypothetical protein
MRGWVCRLQLLLTFASSLILGSESRVTHDHILPSHTRDFSSLEDQVPVFLFPQEQGDPLMPPGTWFPFRRLLQVAGLRWRYSTPSPRGVSLSQPAWGSWLYSLVADRIENTAFNSFSIVTGGFLAIARI